MTTMTTAPFTAARVQGRYRVLDEAGQIVLTLNSKAKAEARAAELNAEHAEAALLAQVEADVAMEQTMDAECPQEDAADLSDLQAEWDAHPEYAEAMVPASEEDDEPVIVRAGEAAPLAEQDVPLQEIPAPAAEERQEEPQEPTGTEDTPAAPAEAEKPAKGNSPMTVQPAPHAFTTVGTTVKNHCTDCGRSWAAAAHRKFREAQQGEVAEVAAEGEWTPAADDTTEDGKAPAENATA
jgi:hypothetical protein